MFFFFITRRAVTLRSICHLFTRMPRDSYRRRFRTQLCPFCLCVMSTKHNFPPPPLPFFSLLILCESPIGLIPTSVCNKLVFSLPLRTLSPCCFLCVCVCVCVCVLQNDVWSRGEHRGAAQSRVDQYGSCGSGYRTQTWHQSEIQCW